VAVSFTSFTLPRAAVTAHVLLTAGDSRPGQLFVSERVPQHDGPETVLEMLNRPEPFFAFRPDHEKKEAALLVSKTHTVSVAVDHQAPIADPARLNAAKVLALELVLAGGSTLRGHASVELPPHQSRLLDYLNSSREAFFVVWTDATTYHVNRDHVLYARPLD